MYGPNRRRSNRNQTGELIWEDWTTKYDLNGIGKDGNPINIEAPKEAENHFHEVSRYSNLPDQRLELMNEFLYLAESQAQGCGGYEYNQFIWIGSVLKQARDAVNRRYSSLAVAANRNVMNGSVIHIGLDDAPIVQWDTKNGTDMPYIHSLSAREWILRGGVSGVTTARESLRLATFIEGKEAAGLNWRAEGSFLAENARLWSKPKYATSVYAEIGFEVESTSDWWEA